MVFTPSQQPDWLHWLTSCPSTNSWGLSHLSQLAHGDVIFTPQQTAGRGQQGRIWQSPKGTLTASFILHGIPVPQLSGLSLVAGLTVIDAIADCCPEVSSALGWKWPNDVLIDRKKLAGILCESVTSSTKSHGSVVIGIGLNRQAEFHLEPGDSDLHNRATSLHNWVSSIPTELSLLERLRYHLLEYFYLNPMDQTIIDHDDLQQTQRLAAVVERLRQRDILLGQMITLKLGGSDYSGEAVGISDRGHLRLKLPTGEVRSFFSGHILW
jgi:BirA family transcriptional regulator, biotin operon repressor / biotin---[acetyl-CoA-carboxylase] ligase